MTSPPKPTIKEMVAPGQKVNFQHYVAGNLWYRTDTGFDFPVPIEDCGNATFLAQDKAMLFMRYIRKHLEELDKKITEKFNQEPAGQ